MAAPGTAAQALNKMLLRCLGNRLYHCGVPDLTGTLHRLDLEYFCLYRGELEPDMAEVTSFPALPPFLMRSGFL
jgi:hypothetical protein